MRSEPRIRVALFGLGGVGRAFLDLVAERSAPVDVVAVADSSGVVVEDVDPRAIVSDKASGDLAARARPLTASVTLRACRAQVAVDVTGTDFSTAEPSWSILSAALSEGIAAVTANKAALARRWDRLQALAGGGPGVGCTAAAGAALPAVAVARSLARADDVAAIEGVLTGTTTFVLDELAEGRPLGDAVAAARAEGIAEPDARVDLEGWDTAAKLVILANLTWPGTGVVLDDVDVRGIDDGTPGSVAGGPVRVLGRAVRVGDRVSASVTPTELDAAHPLAGLAGREKGVVFSGPEIGRVVVAGGRSHPRAAAAAVLADVLELGGRSVPAGDAAAMEEGGSAG